ncbi:MAG: AAA domain-containing protein [Burkholderiales bacterium]
MAQSDNSVSPKQLYSLDKFSKKHGWRLPRGIKTDRTLARQWLGIAFAIDSGALLTKPKSEEDSRKNDEVKDHCLALAEHYGFDAPASFSHDDLLVWIAALGKHVLTPDADKLLQYWQDALTYCDLNKLVEKGLDVAPGLKAGTLSQFLPPPRGLDAGAVDEGHVAAVLVAYSVSRHKKKTAALLAIPLALDVATQRFVPVSGGAAPFFNREWLEPVDPDREKPAYFGTVSDCEQFVRDTPPPSDATTWPEYWVYVESFVRAICGDAVDVQNLAQAVGGGDTHWKIVPWQTQGAGVAIAHVYQQALEGASASLLRQLTKPPFAPNTMDEGQAIARAPQLTGHMDTYDAKLGCRDGFGLERSQRVAATALTAIPSGQILAINGPPGTGKTSFLRAVIATCWVDAALRGKEPPILLATAATNKAVTNIIESFSAIPGPALKPEWASRWLPGLPSYGWFFPAGSKKDEDLAAYMLLRRPQYGSGDATPYSLRGAASEFATAAVDQRAWLLAEFLELHRRCAGLAHAEVSAARAAASIQGLLATSVLAMQALQQRFTTWLALAGSNTAFKQPHAHWADEEMRATREVAENETRHAGQSAALITLTQALAKVAQAEHIETQGRTWWARLMRPVLGDRWGPHATTLRSTALAELAGKGLAEQTSSLSVTALQRRVSDQQQSLAASTTALTAARAVLISAQRTRQQVEAWRSEALSLVRSVVMSDDVVTDKAQVWCDQAITAPTELALAFEAEIDRTFRFLHFHLAARYWEARWLADPPTQADSDDERTALRRAAMLAPVIVSTVYTLPRIHRSFEFAELLIFDESGQASPEIGAASFAFAKRAIVVGDTAQLKPVWNLDAAGSARLAVDRGIDAVPDAVSSCLGSVMQAAQGVTQYTDGAAHAQAAGINLKAHYRCRADIIEYNRRLLYGDLLVPCRKETPPFIYPPMAWVGVASVRGARRHYQSWINEDEVEEIVRWLRHEGPRLLEHYNKTTLAQVVAVIAPFRAQAESLQTALTKQFGEAARDMVINTVHALQGAEKPIVAFSLTQTVAPFFVDSDGPNLLNVAVSRAQDSFILFAAPSVLKRTGHGKRTAPLDLLIDYLAERGKCLYPRECVIIEAPGKQDIVEAALGLSARVIATHGHFRELTHSTQGVRFQATKAGEGTMQLLRQAAAEMGHYDAIYLATDDDDDGEEIAWHVMQVLQEAGLRSENKFRRMRFYALTPKEIRRARELALPGIDARRVKASLMRKVVDARLHDALRQQGVTTSRPELALLREIVDRTAKPTPFGIQVQGHCNGQAVTGYLMDGVGTAALPRWFHDRVMAEAAAEQLSGKNNLPLVRRFDMQQVGAWSPANTTAQVLSHAYRQWQWLPSRTMDALRALYEGKTTPRALGTGDHQASSL